MASEKIDDLLAIMAKLRDPQTGCPWDRQQTFASIAAYTIEEAHEVADVIDREAWDELADELGDLLLQVVFHSQMADEAGWFNFESVCDAITDKMVRRHPHVFSDKTANNPDEVKTIWEAAKAAESGQQNSILDKVTRGLPALQRATKIQKKAARLGFDWPDQNGVIDKVKEEIGELETALHANNTRNIEEELGDLLFSCVNLSRHLGCDADAALRNANLKFEQRFRKMEAMAGGSDALAKLDADQQNALWDQIKMVPQED